MGWKKGIPVPCFWHPDLPLSEKTHIGAARKGVDMPLSWDDNDKENIHATADGTTMRKRNTSDHSYTRPDSQGTMYVLRLSGFWGTLIAIATLLLLLPLVMAFFLLFVMGLVAVAVIGIGYAWWHGKKLRRVHTPYEDVIELSASEYHALEEPGGKTRGTEAER
jgi:hypothetical protein